MVEKNMISLGVLSVLVMVTNVIESSESLSEAVNGTCVDKGVAELLIEQGAEANVCKKRCWTQLVIASSDKELCEFLIENFAELDKNSY